MAGKKITLVIARSKPRNPFLVAALTRRAGPHGATGKAIRQRMRQRTQQSLAALLDGDKAEFEIDERS
ncbi:MAG: hypothetical protein AW09_003263 [Candidatus Accumulibacter phosphatis]|jgi:hypothetical protein|uniref:Uncharacterized protein n=1 Tax=Candidatus Accumulibacter phosphatis TaxID=327160 RepID=A0A080LT04_9PROT|nr:MAG: hypothetical protein AW09_003263 [Candidatus Accumulibacter phosphatis]HRF12835.1 hypothetical protein [Candidatus Accumulibacter phosphatis]